MSVTINSSLQNRLVDSWGGDLDLGFIRIYTGSQPGANTAPTGTLLVSCALTADAYGASASGVATKNGTVQGTAGNTGTAGYAQQVNAGGTRWQYGSVTATGGGGNVELDTLSITTSQTVTITTSTISIPAS